MPLPEHEVDGWLAAFRREFVREPPPFLAVNIVDVNDANLALFRERSAAMWPFMSKISPVERVVWAETDYGIRWRILSVVRYKGPIDPDAYYRDVGDNEEAQAAFRSVAEAMEDFSWFVVREVDQQPVHGAARPP